jgi:hypothetical protein
VNAPSASSLVLVLAAVAVSLLGAPPLAAKEQLLDAAPMVGKKVRLDGLLKEWPKLVVLTEKLQGGGSQKDPRALGVVGYDNENLYVAMRVKDKRFVRTAAFGKNEDHAILSLAFPTGTGGFKSYSVLLYPGDPGKAAGAVKLSGKGKVPGAQIVEAPMEGGFAFEANIPWKTFPEARWARSGLRGVLKYYDVDSGKATLVATSGRVGKRAPLLTLEAEYALHQSMIFPKGLSVKPDEERIGNVVGDRMMERVAVYDRYLAITGWNYRGGQEFYFQDIQVMKPSDLAVFRLLDCTGDGRQDIVLRRRVHDGSASREYLEVYTVPSEKDPPRRVFEHEVGISVAAGNVSNQVEFKKNKGQWDIVVSVGRGDKVDVDEWGEPVAGGDTQPTLLPWQATTRRRYSYKSTGFEMVDEETGKPRMKGAPKRAGTKFWSGKGPPGRQRAGRDVVHEAAPAPAGSRPEPPRPPSPEERLDKVYAMYRQERGQRKQAPRFDFVTNVAGSDAPERVLIHGRDIVVFGKKFKDASSYVFTQVGVKDAEHILAVSAMDITGDGHAEVVVRGIIPATASKALGGQTIERHALFIYKVTADAIRRIFAVETGRSLEDNMILQQVAFMPGSVGMKIQLRPGRAFGWTQETYPFPEDRHPYAGLEPLLLPWTAMSPRTYLYRGGAFELLE